MKHLKELRERSGMTFDEMALKFGHQKSTIFNWENDISKPRLQDLLKLSDYFHVSVDYLLDRDSREIKINELFIELEKANYETILKLIKDYLVSLNG